MNTKLEPIRVKLLSWDNPDNQTLNLYFERVPPYISMREFTKPGFPITIHSDFGYINITLQGNNFDYPKETSWLNEYINYDAVFLEEEAENEITFWEGEHEDKYDWVSSYSIRFNSKQVEYLPISSEDWKTKYTQMALKWDTVFNDRYDILHHDFLRLFIDVTKGKIDTLMRDSKNQELEAFKNGLKGSLDSWLIRFEERKKEMEEFYEKSENSPLNNAKTQESVNSELSGFWRRLRDKFK